MTSAIINRAIQIIFVFFMRGLALLLRFILNLYIAKFLGLSPLGEFGLISGIASVMPTIMGFSFINHTCRVASHGDYSVYCSSIANYWTIVAIGYSAITIFFTIIFNEEIANSKIIAVALFALSEHIATDMFILLAMMSRSTYANLLFLLRSGGSVCIFILLHTLFPGYITIYTSIALSAAFNIISFFGFFWATKEWEWVKPFRQFRLRNILLIIRDSSLLYINDVINTAGQYIDRYVVTYFLGLELTGAYILFWTIGNALSTLINSGVIIVYRPQILMSLTKNRSIMITLVSRLVKEVFLYCAVIAISLYIAMYFLIPIVNQPLARSNFIILVPVLIGFTLRMIYEAVGIPIYITGHDKESIKTTVLVLLIVLGLNFLLIPRFGLHGAAAAGIVGYGLGGLTRWYIFKKIELS